MALPSTEVSHRFVLPALLGVSAFGATAMIVGGGCTVLTNDALPDDAGVYEGGDASVATCPACVAEACIAAWALCLTDDGCIDVRTCARTSDPTTCACSAASDGGLASGDLYRAFAACNDAHTCKGACATDCASSCTSTATTAPASCDRSDADVDAGGDTGDAGDDAGDASTVDGGDAAAPPTADTCASCTSSKCDRATAACAVGSECAAFLTCVFGCTDGTCTDACAQSHATGKVAAIELASCAGSSCQKECGL